MAGYKVEICGVNTATLPLLDNSEKETLFHRIKNGDQQARELYITGNLRLVLSVIGRFSSSGENIDELSYTARTFKAFIDSLKIAGIEELKSDFDEGKPEVIIDIRNMYIKVNI